MKTNNVISEETKLPKIETETFKSSLRGELIFPGEEEYDQSRTIWNGVITSR